MRLLDTAIRFGYASSVAETTATGIGVLYERGESHSESSGYFYVLCTLYGRRWTGGRKAAGTPRSRYANPVQLPPTPIGVGGRFYKTNRSCTMNHTNLSVSTRNELMMGCAIDQLNILNIAIQNLPDVGKFSNALYGTIQTLEQIYVSAFIEGDDHE